VPIIAHYPAHCANCCPLLPIIAHYCPLFPIIAHYCPLWGITLSFPCGCGKNTSREKKSVGRGSNAAHFTSNMRHVHHMHRTTHHGAPSADTRTTVDEGPARPSRQARHVLLKGELHWRLVAIEVGHRLFILLQASALCSKKKELKWALFDTKCL
jgi:hypothetical protein